MDSLTTQQRHANMVAIHGNGDTGTGDTMYEV